LLENLTSYVLTKNNKMKIWITIILTSVYLVSKAPNKNLAFQKLQQEKSIEFYKQSELQRFLKDMRFIESGNNWKIINSLGAMGHFQFMPNTLKLLDCELTPDIFKKIPWIFPAKMQEKFMIELLNRNAKSLEYFINKYENKAFRNILITKSGILAAAHLAGVNNVRKWFLGGINKYDINKTSLECYMVEFGGYNF